MDAFDTYPGPWPFTPLPHVLTLLKVTLMKMAHVGFELTIYE